jgi:hypothetical protein
MATSIKIVDMLPRRLPKSTREKLDRLLPEQTKYTIIDLHEDYRETAQEVVRECGIMRLSPENVERRLVARLEQLGYEVVLQPSATTS